MFIFPHLQNGERQNNGRKSKKQTGKEKRKHHARRPNAQPVCNSSVGKL